MSVPGKETKQYNGTISESKPKVPKTKLGDQDSNFECYKKSDGKLVHVEVVKEVTTSDERSPTLALPSNKSEEDENNNIGEIGLENNGFNGIISVRISSKKFRTPECLGSRFLLLDYRI